MVEGEERWTISNNAASDDVDTPLQRVRGPRTGWVEVVRLSRFEEVQRRYEELEGDYALRLSHLMAEEEHAKALAADLERAQESLGQMQRIAVEALAEARERGET